MTTNPVGRLFRQDEGRLRVIGALINKTVQPKTPIQLVGAGVACLNPAGEVLLIRRRDNGLWDVPGGRVEVGEATEAAARRELLEETGLEAGALELLAVFSGPDTLHTYPDGNAVAWVTVLYLCRSFLGTCVAGDDAAEVGWFSLDEFPDASSAATVGYLEAIKEGLT